MEDALKLKPLDFMNCNRDKEIYTKKGHEGFRVKKDYVELGDKDGYFYIIDFDRLKTKGALLEWVYHLSQKNWITRCQLWSLMTFCMDKFGYNCYEQ